jgi:peptide/nickel transport system permease protein
MRKFFYKRKLDEIEEKARPIHINSYRQLVWAKFKSHKLAVLGAVMLIGVVIFTLIGPLSSMWATRIWISLTSFSPPFTEVIYLEQMNWT